MQHANGRSYANTPAKTKENLATELKMAKKSKITKAIMSAKLKIEPAKNKKR